MADTATAISKVMSDALPPAPEETAHLANHPRISQSYASQLRPRSRSVPSQAPPSALSNQRNHLDSDVYDLIPHFVGAAFAGASREIGGLPVTTLQSEIWEDEEEDEEDAIRNLQEEFGYHNLSNVPLKKKRKTTSKHVEIPPECREAYGKANKMYIFKDYAAAIDLLHQVIRICPSLHTAWMLLAAIHDEIGDRTQALHSLYVAAHIDTKNTELWRKLFIISMKIGNKEQALYCVNRAYRSDRSDPNNLWEIARLAHQQGQFEKAINTYEQLLELAPHYMPAIRHLAKIYVMLNQHDRAIPLFEGALHADLVDPLPAHVPPLGIIEPEVLGEEEDDDFGDDDIPRRVGWEELNMMTELYLDTNQYEKVIQCIHMVAPCLSVAVSLQPYIGVEPCYNSDDARFLDTDDALPVELRVKLGIARLYLDMPDLASVQFHVLFKRDAEEEIDLYLDVADAYVAKRVFVSALMIFDRLSNFSEADVPDIWAKRAYCYYQLGYLQEAEQIYSSVLQVEPTNNNVRILLAEVYQKMGDTEKAHQLADQVANASQGAQPEPSVFQNHLVTDTPTKKRPIDNALKIAEQVKIEKENKVALLKLKDLELTHPNMSDKLAR
ncbi:General transcription factor IIIC, polypeptide 3 [Nowakowskiella sp. JEL0078]|nr:General transcription factor IIIC, polypeptide 3 [Nowakowskiella sp. JEL0078]